MVSKIRTLEPKVLYYKRFSNQAAIRDPLSTNVDVPFAGFIHPENPPSGAYGGASLVWFPTENNGSIITFGAAGLSPHEGLLSCPGHRHGIRVLRRYCPLERNHNKKLHTKYGKSCPGKAISLGQLLFAWLIKVPSILRTKKFT